MKRDIITFGVCILTLVFITGCSKDNTKIEKNEAISLPVSTTEAVNGADEIETQKAKPVNEMERGDIEYVYNTESVLLQGDLFQPVDNSVSDNAELVLLYSNMGQNLYYSKENIKDGTDTEYEAGQLVLENADKQYVFDVSFQYDYMAEGLSENEFPYVYSKDYDGDGENEIALTVILDYGSGGMMFEKVFVIDYSDISNDYVLYCFGINNFSDVIDEAVMEYYKQQFSLDYVVTDKRKTEYKNNVSNEYECYMNAENGNPIRFGDITGCSSEDSNFIFDVTVHEAYGDTTELQDDIENDVYYWMGRCLIKVKYMGNGLFEVKPDKYIEFGPA